MEATRESVQERHETNASSIGEVPARVPFKGVHHLVLNTDDIKVTIDFYAGVLGMRLIHAMKVPPGISRGIRHSRNCAIIFSIWATTTCLPSSNCQRARRGKLIATEWRRCNMCRSARRPSRPRNWSSESTPAGIRRAGPLQAAPGCWSIYFFDPHGVRLEVSYQPAQGDTQQNVEHFRQTRAQMLGELRTVSHDGAWLDRVTMHLAD